jgi:DsbC/DsbD-like thiol-disulfide interchange protein
MMKFALLVACLASPALAQSQEDVLQAQLLSGWRLAGGHYMAAVDLQLAPDWKTYWRAPGEAGIPPVFDWTGSENLKSVAFHWPSPKVITLNGMMSIGYLNELVLPVEVVAADPGKPVKLALKMDLGICHDICMPAHVALAASLQGAGKPDDRIAAALAAGPKVVSGANCTVTPISDGLRLTAHIALPAQGRDETVVFETADPQVWVASSTTARQGPVLVSQTDLVPPAGAPFSLDRSAVTVTVLAADHSVEIHGCPAP